jgi:hypothetical protein
MLTRLVIMLGTFCLLGALIATIIDRLLADQPVSRAIAVVNDDAGKD